MVALDKTGYGMTNRMTRHAHASARGDANIAALPAWTTVTLIAAFLLLPHTASAAKTATPDPTYDNLTYTLPDGASPVRLSLPASISDIFAGPKNGLVGFGLHAGGHLEGLDHVWIELKAGVPVRSWADGRVTDVRKNGDEYHIGIDYGRNLIGVHMEILKPYVKKGQHVKRGQKVGLGMSYDPSQSSAEFQLIDKGRADGVDLSWGGTAVSPYDYLRASEKQKLVAAYKKYVLAPYRSGGTGSTLLQPYEPMLTNRIDLTKRAKGKIEGVWYSLKKWTFGYPNDILTFLAARNPYYRGNRVFAADDVSEGDISAWSIDGTYAVDYARHRIRIVNGDGTEYLGLFKIEPWKRRERLTIEYQTGAYPTSFTARALRYASRTNVPRRSDAVKLGVRATE